MRYGFILDGKFHDNYGLGHEATARKIIQNNCWLEQWVCGSAQDFLVLEKRAVQIGSGAYSDKIIASSKFYNHSTLDRICKKFELHNYKYVLVR